ncbi:MAG: hypothetical protein QOD63_2469, partial [Actinomycetota bacterium]|nr:hypothetical protein [Actinomycetota bacterium]
MVRHPPALVDRRVVDVRDDRHRVLGASAVAVTGAPPGFAASAVAASLADSLAAGLAPAPAAPAALART